MPRFTLLLLASIVVNFLVGRHIVAVLRARGAPDARRWLALGVVFNLGLLGYFKYANFFVDNINALLGMDWRVGRILLPIGISFYSFTQIAFLVDAYEGKVNEANPVHFGLFVTYFPHLVAGPVLHHAQMMPQFADPSIYRLRADHFVGGLAIFVLGLFKKVVFADGIAPYADAVFNPVDGGAIPTFGEAWLGALAYTLQLYFDFSGYSDMAVGMSWMFNVRLPFNFNSPYQAHNISDFWRRWHISLSNFLRDYLYIPLGGNRSGAFRRYLNLSITMLLGGLWHGASWSFVCWGGLHGLYLMAHHGFRAALGVRARAWLDGSRAWSAAAWTLTLLAVIAAWVFFRAQSLPGAARMIAAMLPTELAAEPVHALLWNAGLQSSAGAAWCVVLGAVALFGRNSNRLGVALMARLAAGQWLRPLLGGAAACAVAMLLLVNIARDSVSAFIYFNF